MSTRRCLECKHPCSNFFADPNPGRDRPLKAVCEPCSVRFESRVKIPCEKRGSCHHILNGCFCKAHATAESEWFCYHHVKFWRDFSNEYQLVRQVKSFLEFPEDSRVQQALNATLAAAACADAEDLTDVHRMIVDMFLQLRYEQGAAFQAGAKRLVDYVNEICGSHGEACDGKLDHLETAVQFVCRGVAEMDQRIHAQVAPVTAAVESLYHAHNSTVNELNEKVTPALQAVEHLQTAQTAVVDQLNAQVVPALQDLNLLKEHVVPALHELSLLKDKIDRMEACMPEVLLQHKNAISSDMHKLLDNKLHEIERNTESLKVLPELFLEHKRTCTDDIRKSVIAVGELRRDVEARLTLTPEQNDEPAPPPAVAAAAHDIVRSSLQAYSDSSRNNMQTFAATLRSNAETWERIQSFGDLWTATNLTDAQFNRLKELRSMRASEQTMAFPSAREQMSGPRAPW